ncbi:MAG: PdxA family dehydrogenase [Brevinematia bacterium]
MVGITIGDPKSISPEVVLKSIKSLGESFFDKVLLIGSYNVFSFWNDFYNFSLPLSLYGSTKGIQVFDIGYDKDFEDIDDFDCAKISISSIDLSIKLIKEKVVNSIVTGPVSKYRISKVIPDFVGHTGYYARAFGIENYNMAFYSDDLKIVLLTDHIPLKKVFEYLSEERLFTTINNAIGWIRSFKRSEPIIGICGLNPHAGEEGNIGNEENLIKRVISKFNNQVIGPLPPDTAFIEYKKRGLDCLVCLYHDQGLIGFKLMHFDDGVNVTIGLPFVRCSPDHGTAFDIVGKGIANYKSMLNSIKYALMFE